MRMVSAGVLALVAVTLAGSARARQSPPAAPAPPAGSTAPGSDVATEADVKIACGTCHSVPPPDVLPKGAWRDEIARMSLIRGNLPQPSGPIGTAARMIVLPPDYARVLRYYQAAAPQKLPPPATWPAANTLTFVKRALNPVDAPGGPAIADVRLFDVDGDGTLEILAADMRFGLVMLGRPYRSNAPLDVIAQLSNPSHISMVDFDRDGVKDFFVADLGEYLPSDHTHGSVVLLRGTREGKYQQLALDGWPRVAAVEMADVNGDGTEDVAVAAFGWRKVGNLTLLENHTVDYAQPSFVPRVLDPRPGAIRAVPTDLNKDGKVDLVALFAQQFETVVGFVNDGTGGFTPQVLYTAPHPNWGSSGIEVADLDRDGDPDVILTHGDTFDDQIIKPYHGIQWLENRGTFPFVEHALADMPGVSVARAADLDGDGDLDIVAGAFIAGGADIDEAGLPALIWLEQTTRGVFTRHTLEMGTPRHAALDAGDFDHDGDIDIAVGNFHVQGKGAPWVEIWENRRITSAATSTR